MRTSCKYRLDQRVTEALRQIAAIEGMSPAQYVERLLFAHAQTRGAIEMAAKPLGELRGGRRTAKKKPG